MKINYQGKSKILKNLCTEVNKLTEDNETICRQIGNLVELTTAEKQSLVAAVNEVRGMVDGILEGAS